MKSTDSNRKLLLDFLGYVDLELNLASNTIAAYRQDLTDFIEFLESDQRPPVSSANDADLLDFMISLRKRGISARSAARKLSTLKHFYKFLQGEGKVANDPTSTLESPKLLRALPEVFSREEIDRLMEAYASDDPLSQRNKAILELWYACGLRISEVAGLRMGNVVFEADVIRVKGKGNKERLVPFGKYARRALQEYLRDSRPKLLRDNTFDILFVSRKGGKLSRMGLWSIFEKALMLASITREVTPHSLRHTCATHMIEGGADIRTVMEFLGHADITTTQIYTHLDQKYLKEVHRRFHPREKENESSGSTEITNLDSSDSPQETG